ncbi:uncharacterized protein OCT59_028194 [Rhizophagus irregularis]|uniref:Calcium-dependent phosphotriesterase n=3 Tax=Rhizophagus irregularis TaxID=588596 RepID=U9SMQ0_RHIID|nr:hypothetical protein GLOIN_2v1510487 [Rhizophagus irregularis DAOM 181602=DAOM 197198]EXX68886.1 hypothetical protein RirG_101100 [Rhizophagus irregularis DAOM 197198w]PKK69163.1 calcium-dependent phosphotriesterase [Rhizophagus irregularis]PKY14162.1 calcium-dependent phosphotriesterase [Rhizophagus irregularis]POG81102.1 hypothetical protein GLOIN_2v1510487 [Rhizophagus irregularis DAOM 181602=DAOM 197198]UZO07924.1 hypothetical protein OCT59_028194 [Rhizophagus irregularis]|eukprot:XP_025187968.1 hypothetical protein GLOIN_2v1510487 [Rhizophagus irregularis DAOM 181602=DAOM 197198]
MFRSITILVLIFAIITALSYNWIYEFYTVFGYNRPHIKPYENGKCRKIEGVEACEDIHIHHRTGYAFMACGKEIERIRGYWPPIGTYNSSIQSIDTPYIYDINNDKLIPLVLKNFPPEEDFATHGLGIYEDPENENKLYLFFVNHKRSGSCFEIFEHTLHTNELIHLETIQHELINTPNDVFPVSRHEFYFTNDHYFSNPINKLLEYIFPLPWANVVFHSSITNETKIVAEMRTPNGITANFDHSLLYVATTSGHVLIYERNKNNNELKLKDKMFTGYATDNLSVDEETGEIYGAIFQDLYQIMIYGNDLELPLMATGIFKISNNTKGGDEKYSLETIFEDDGSLYKLTTIAAVDRKRNTLLLGSYRSKGIVRCDSLEP